MQSYLRISLIWNCFFFSGSCTACVVALDTADQMLYTANLGDSGLLVIRRGQVVHRSQEQQHYFNTPFQLSVAPTVLEGVVLSDRWVMYLISQTILFISTVYALFLADVSVLNLC